MFEWEFKTKKDKWPWWYSIALIVSLALIIWWYVTWIYVMSIVVIIMVWVYSLVDNNSPDMMHIEINENWILVWEIFYDYPKIESFAIIYSKNIPIFLRLRLKTRWFKMLDIPLEWVKEIASMRSFLLSYVEEDEKWEISSVDRLLDYLKL